jgi:lipopolysaccharide export system protein LptC
MPARRILPDNATLKRWRVDEGLSIKAITERVYDLTGEKVGSSTVSVALARAGISPSLPRYHEEIPWTVRAEHAMAYQARMLRDLGRRRAGKDLREDEARRLDSWLAKIKANNAVVAYDPDYGFFYVEADEKGDRPKGIPIRPRPVTYADYE